MKKTLKENINAYYQAYRLPRRQLLRLQNIQRRSRPFFGIGHSQSIWAPVAVAVALVMVALVTFKPLSRPDNIKDLISEIVYNHNKNLDVEIRSNSLEEVRNFLSELDFPLIKSQRLSPDTWGLIGGRYCSLLGQFAAQLKMRNKVTNNSYTFYQVQKPPAITEISGFSEYYDKGVKVNLWIERGLILALAGNSE
jgi:hypothetical protein